MDKKFQERFDALTANIPEIVKERLLKFIEDVEDEAYGRGYSEADQVEFE